MTFGGNWRARLQPEFLGHGTRAIDYEAITVDAAVHALTPARYDDAQGALITVEDDAIRFRIDGTDPTAAEGHYVDAGEIVVLTSIEDLQRFRVTRVTTDAIIRITYQVVR